MQMGILTRDFLSSIRIMKYGQVDYMYGEALYKPEMKEGNPIRLYSLDEITEIFCKLGLRICNSFADFSGKPSSDNDIQFDGLFHTRIKIE